MTDLIAQLEARLAMDKIATRNQAKYEDSDCYFGFLSGAEWTYDSLADLHAALVECVRALDKIADPRKRGHREPDAYTTVGGVIHIAQDALDSLRLAMVEGKK